MDKTEILSKTISERARLEAVVKRVPESDRSQPVLSGGWSVKTALAHIAAWERLTLLRLEAALSGSEPRFPPIGTDAEIDAFNAEILASTAGAPYDAVHAEFAAAHADLISKMGTLDDEFLNSALPETWGRGRPAWQLIAANTFWHYPEHTEEIERWLRMA